MPNVINNWPNADLHNLNLDWILNEIKTLGIKVTNTEKYIPHVANWNNGQWDVNHEYSMNEIVFNGNEIYIAIKNVPAQVNINDTMYWALVGTDSYITNKVDKAGDTMTGPLNTPGLDIYHNQYGNIYFRQAMNTDPAAAVYADVANHQLVFRLYGNSENIYTDYKLPINATLSPEIYDVITSKGKIPWTAATSWPEAVNNAKMDVLIGYDALLGGVSVRFTIIIPIVEIDNTLRYHFSSTATTSAGESYVNAGVNTSGIQVLQIVTQGVPTTIQSAFLFYR